MKCQSQLMLTALPEAWLGTNAVCKKMDCLCLCFLGAESLLSEEKRLKGHR